MSAQSDIERSVSRETIDALKHYQSLLAKWTRRVSLVSKGDEASIWDRHILDSLQLWPMIMEHAKVVDFGSGGGLPGLVIAICQRFQGYGEVVLIESDQRKCAFLRLVTAELSLPATVISERIRSTSPQNANVSTARALAPLDELLPHTLRHTTSPHEAYFHKGRLADEELKNAAEN